MITTKNFRDSIEMRRGIKNLRGSMFDVFIEPYKPLVPRYLRLGVDERTLYNGKIAHAVERAGTPYRRSQAAGRRLHGHRHLFPALLRKRRQRAQGQAHRAGNGPRRLRHRIARNPPGLARVRAVFHRCRQRLYRPGRHPLCAQAAERPHGARLPWPAADDAGQRTGAGGGRVRGPRGLSAQFRPRRRTVGCRLSWRPARQVQSVVDGHGRHQLRRVRDQERRHSHHHRIPG